MIARQVSIKRDFPQKFAGFSSSSVVTLTMFETSKIKIEPNKPQLCGEVIVTLRERTFQRGLVSVVIVLVLSACGGGGSSDGDRTIVDNTVVNISSTGAADLIADVRSGSDLDLSEVEAWDGAISPIAGTLFSSNPVTPWANVPPPTSGTASYVGGLELVPNGNTADRVFGTLRATTDFGAASSITGTADNFVHTQSGDQLTGELALGGQFFRGNDLTTEFGISGAITGDLTGTGITGAVNVDVAGDFADSGTVIYGGGTGTAGSGSVEAAFVLSQN